MVSIHKFGGSCLSTPDDIEAICARIAAQPGEIVAVVSAFHGVTDRLIEQLHAGDTRNIDAFVSAIELHHIERVPQITESVWHEQFRATLTKLADALHTYAVTPTREGRAQTLACGERLSSLCIAAALNAFGTAGTPAWSEDVGIRLDGVGEAAVVDIEATRANLDLPKGAVPILTGWYGMSGEGLALLGRGGSDLTATSLGAVMDAEEVTIWRDVPGVLALAPRWSLPSRNVNYLSYTEAAELALFSEPMLHPIAVEPLRDLGIPLRLRPLHQPEAVGTQIGPSISTDTDQMVRAIGCLPHLVPITWRLSSAVSLATIVGEATQILARARIRVWSLRAKPGEARLLIDSRSALRATRLLERMSGLPMPEVGDEISLICFVGEEIGWNVDAKSRIQSVADEYNLDLRPFDEGLRPHALQFTMPAGRTEAVLRRICEALGLLTM